MLIMVNMVELQLFVFQCDLVRVLTKLVNRCCYVLRVSCAEKEPLQLGQLLGEVLVVNVEKVLPVLFASKEEVDFIYHNYSQVAQVEHFRSAP
jgi:hypothetical protein